MFNSDYMLYAIFFNQGEKSMNKINKVLQVGNLANQIESTRENPNRHDVYLPNGIAPALCTMSGGGLQPEIVVAETRDKRQETRDKRL
jgi:hypothetical protein